MNSCQCGCGLIGNGKFRPGHDARLHGRVKRAAEGRLNWAELSESEAAAVKAHEGKALPGSFGIAKAAKASSAQSEEAIALERAARAARVFLANLPGGVWCPELEGVLADLVSRQAAAQAEPSPEQPSPEQAG